MKNPWTRRRKKRKADWPTDVVAWAEANVWLRNPETGQVGPIKLVAHQRRWLERATKRDKQGNFVHRVVVASWPKREGKSSMAAILVCWRLVCFEGQRVGIIANSALQAKSNVFDMACSIFQQSPALAEYVNEDSFLTTELTVWPLDNTAKVFPANHRTIQGIQFDVIAVDELHASENTACFVYASQQTEGLDAQVVISSQAGAPVDGNPLWRLHRAKAKHIYFDYRTDVATPWAVRLAAAAKSELLPGEYSYLWGNAWGATGFSLISARDVEAAALNFEPPQTRDAWEKLKAEWGWGYCSIGCGLDRAGVSATGDDTVWTVVARFQPPNGECVFRVVGQWVLPTGSEAEILDCDHRTREIFGPPAALFFEAYNSGDIWQKCQGATLEAPSTQRQQGLFNRLARLFREGRFGYSRRFSLLKAQLIRFEYDAESGPMLRFGSQSGHDDTVYSLAWACEAADSCPIVAAPTFTFDGETLKGLTPEERWPEGAGVHIIGYQDAQTGQMLSEVEYQKQQQALSEGEAEPAPAPDLRDRLRNAKSKGGFGWSTRAHRWSGRW